MFSGVKVSHFASAAGAKSAGSDCELLRAGQEFVELKCVEAIMRIHIERFEGSKYQFTICNHF